MALAHRGRLMPYHMNWVLSFAKEDVTLKKGKLILSCPHIGLITDGIASTLIFQVKLYLSTRLNQLI